MRLKKIGSSLLSFILILVMAFPVQASSGSISDIEKKQSQIKESINSANSEISNLESSQNELKTRVTELNTQLMGLSDSLTALEEQAAAKQQELETTQQELEEAKATEAQQYEDMKKRIRFMYEKSDTAYIELLLSSESFTDFLNRAENISQISEYDRNMLREYEATKITVEEKETQVASEKEAILALQAETEVKQEEVSTLLTSTSDEIKNYAAEIEATKQQKAGYETEYANQQTTLNRLIAEAEAEEQRLKEEAAAAEAAKIAAAEKAAAAAKNAADTANVSKGNQTTSGGGSSTPKDPGIQKPSTGTPTAPPPVTPPSEPNNTPSTNTPASTSDLNLLAALIYCEAGGEGYEGQIAVGAVVMNRVRSSSFPNTVSGVIYQSGQFSPAASGRLLMVLSGGQGNSCLAAAQAVLGGSNNIGSCLFFKRADGTAGTIIGNHVFY